MASWLMTSRTRSLWIPVPISICGAEIVRRQRNGRRLMASLRARKPVYGTPSTGAFSVRPGDEIEVDGVSIRATPAGHGPLELSLPI